MTGDSPKGGSFILPNSIFSDGGFNVKLGQVTLNTLSGPDLFKNR